MARRLPLVLLATLSLAVAGCSPFREASIVAASVTEDGRTLQLSVDACNAERNTAEVEETPEEVRVRVVTTDAPGGDDCADGVAVRLVDALNGRRLVDASTGEVVPVGP